MTILMVASILATVEGVVGTIKYEKVKDRQISLEN